MDLTQPIGPAVGYAGNVLHFLRVTEDYIREKLGKSKYYDFVGNAAVLETVLKRCYQSGNHNLISDFEKHGIPNRLKRISQLVTCSHWHSWVPIAKDRGAFTLERCVKEESEWNCASEKATIMSSGATGSIFPVLLAPIAWRMAAQNVLSYDDHANETWNKLKFVLEETDALCQQVNSLFLGKGVAKNFFKKRPRIFQIWGEHDNPNLSDSQTKLIWSEY